MNDSLYYFSEKSDEESSLKINMDQLFEKKQQQDLSTLNTYNKILKRVHNKILFTSKSLANNECCWYILPEVMVGIPKYNHKDCTVYVIHKLRENGFVVQYIHPNLLFISWKSWIPTYVRNEIKKKTGQSIDEYGNLHSEDEFNNQSSSSNNTLNIEQSFDNLMLNTPHINSSNNSRDKNKNNYKDIKSYNPTGSLIYNNNLLKKLEL